MGLAAGDEAVIKGASTFYDWFKKNIFSFKLRTYSPEEENVTFRIGSKIILKQDGSISDPKIKRSDFVDGDTIAETITPAGDIEDAKILTDSNSSTKEKAIAGMSIILGLGPLPNIGPAIRKSDIAADILKKGKNASGADQIRKSIPTTPNKEAREHVQGEYLDSITGGTVKTSDRLAAYHVYPKKEILKLPGFTDLNKAQQSDILNDLENFQGLPKSQNSSKGSKIGWTKYKGKDLDKKYADDLAKKQQENKKSLQKKIDKMKDKDK